MKTIPINKTKKIAIVDDDDFITLSKFSWNLKRIYASTTMRLNGTRHRIVMHRFILGLTPNDGKIVDHIDRNGLNNQKNNLRLANQRINNMNKSKAKDKKSSKYKGVTYNKKHNKFTAHIKYGKNFHLGYFKTELDAAYAYDLAAKSFFGDYACTNFSIVKYCPFRLYRGKKILFDPLRYKNDRN